MPRKASTSKGPLSGWTVLFINQKFWTSSTTPGRLRALGARIVRKPTATLTHVGTPHDVQDSHLASVGELFLTPRAKDAMTEVRDFAAHHGLPVKFMGPEELQRAVAIAESQWKALKVAVREERERATNERLSQASVSGFVGF